MALRVLLADESTTIKKVMQLALQDYGVDVKSVPVGVDVVPVSKSYKPDIIFIDVLLQKKSGYEVARDVKNDAALSDVPVVLMWSGFMEIDEAKVAEARVDGRLEKPFDTETLRSLIKDLVPRTSESRVSSYLTFPKLPDFDEEPAAIPVDPRSETNSGLSRANPMPPPPTESYVGAHTSSDTGTGADAHFDSGLNSPFVTSPNASFEPISSTNDVFGLPEIGENDEIFSMDTPTDPDDQFRTVPLNMAAKDPLPSGDEIWAHQDLSKFKLQVPQMDVDLTSNTGRTEFEKFLIPGEEMNLSQVETTSGEFEEITFNAPIRGKTPAPAPMAPPAANTSTQRPTDSRGEVRNETVTQSGRTERREAPEARRDFNSDEMQIPNPRAVSTAMDHVTAERILREEAHVVLEKVLWQILPDICERVVKEELNKLLKDVERSI